MVGQRVVQFTIVYKVQTGSSRPDLVAILPHYLLIQNLLKSVFERYWLLGFLRDTTK
jgi:hypothetical protein